MVTTHNQPDLTYETVSSHGEEYRHIRFSGNFNDENVVWDAEIGTLGYYSKGKKKHKTDTIYTRQFIEVGDKTDNGRQIRIGLNVARIDEPTIKKTIIMIRQYKRLSFGRHDYGEQVKVN